MAFPAKDLGERLKAWELYLEASNGGKYRSLRNIASEIGVSSVTIARWKEVDGWDEKLKKILVQTAGTAESTSQAIKRRVRRGLLDGLDELHNMAKDTKLTPKDRIDAIKAISAIALKIEAVTSGAFGKDASNTQTVPDFSDDLEGTQWQPTTEKPSPPEESVEPPSESGEPEVSLTPPTPPSQSPSLPNSEVDLALDPEEFLRRDEGGEQ